MGSAKTNKRMRSFVANTLKKIGALSYFNFENGLHPIPAFE